jgi:hypothetical protein
VVGHGVAFQRDFGEGGVVFEEERGKEGGAVMEASQFEVLEELAVTEPCYNFEEGREVVGFELCVTVCIFEAEDFEGCAGFKIVEGVDGFGVEAGELEGG